MMQKVAWSKPTLMRFLPNVSYLLLMSATAIHLVIWCAPWKKPSPKLCSLALQALRFNLKTQKKDAQHQMCLAMSCIAIALLMVYVTKMFWALIQAKFWLSKKRMHAKRLRWNRLRQLLSVRYLAIPQNRRPIITTWKMLRWRAISMKLVSACAELKISFLKADNTAPKNIEKWWSRISATTGYPSATTTNSMGYLLPQAFPKQ